MLEGTTLILDQANSPACSDNASSLMIAGNFLSARGRNRGVCEDLAERLRANGWRIFTTSQKTGRIARLFDMLSAAWKWRNRYQVVQIDLYSGPAFFWALALGALLRCLAKPFVLTLHGGNLPAFARNWPRLVRWLLKRAASVTAPSGYLKEALQPFRDDILVLPNAIDLSAYPFKLRTSIAPVVVWLRAFHHIYQPTLAVEAFAEVIREFPGARLILAGPDKHDGSLAAARSLADSLGVSKSVEFVGAVAKADVPAFINRGDVFLNTSAVDNHPVTLIEAMACGACIVSTQPGGIPYLLSNDVNGLLVCRNEGSELAKSIARLLHDANFAERLSRQARIAAEAFDWSEILPRWSSLLSELAHPPSNQ